MGKKKESKQKTTQTGEFIPSFNNWTIPETQKKRAKKLADVTESSSPKKA